MNLYDYTLETPTGNSTRKVRRNNIMNRKCCKVITENVDIMYMTVG